MLNNTFKGGIYIPNPNPVKEVKLVNTATPKKVVLPLLQNFCGIAKPSVKVGDKVLTGQVIAKTIGNFSLPIHASISGEITAIDNKPVVHPSSLDYACISIKSDNKDKWVKLKKCDDFLNHKPEEIIKKIKDAGIVGMGGAGFPTYVKVSGAVGAKTIIINATECEPGIMSDDALMQNYPREIIRGVEVLLHTCSAKNAIIAIEDDKKEAFNSLLMYNFNKQIKIKQIPVKYTSGAEKLLVKALLGIEIPPGKLTSSFGILCQNVATVKAIYDAVIDGSPLISRIVTVTGSGVDEPKNYNARLGTSFKDIATKSKPNKQKHQVRIGGMMMGLEVKDTDYSVSKTSNCIFINNFKTEPKAKECIRCGKCNEVCPLDLLPQQLYWYSKSENIEKAIDYNLFDCFECGCCSYVCSSNIPLVKYFQFAKALSRKQNSDKIKSENAKKRFEYKEFRIKRNKEERAIMMAAKKKALQEKMAKDKQQKDKIATVIKNTQEKKDDA